LPLHIFEQRYRQMLNDIQVSNNLFGISYFDLQLTTRDSASGSHRLCGGGSETQKTFFCRTVALKHSPPECDRYQIEEYIERGDPYLVARVSFLRGREDEMVAPQQFARSSRNLHSDCFARFATINDERASVPDISDTEPQQLSFLVAAAMEWIRTLKQELLEMRSTSERLRRTARYAGACRCQL